MKKVWTFLLIICTFPFAGSAQTILKAHIILDGRVHIELPADFKSLSSEKDNAGEWADKNDSTLLLYHLSENDSISDNDIPAFIDDQLGKAKQTDKTFEYIDDGIFLQDGKNIGYLKFSSDEIRRKYFNYIFFVSVDNRLLGVTFVCLFEHRKKWEPVVDIIANSIRIKEKT